MFAAPPPPVTVAYCEKLSPYNRLATMTKDGAITLQGTETITRKRKEFALAFFPYDKLYAEIISQLGDMKPGDSKCYNAPPIVGRASLDKDGSLVMVIWGELFPGVPHEATIETYPPTDPRYETLMRRFPGLIAGEKRDILAPVPRADLLPH